MGRNSRSPSQIRRDEERVFRKKLRENLVFILTELETVQEEQAQILENALLDLLESFELDEDLERLSGEILSKL